MMKNKKLVKSLSLALITGFMIISLPTAVKAEYYTGGDGWSVTFNGSAMESTFKNADIDDAIYALQPGDTVELHLALSNSYSETTDWYMSNEVLQSLEDSQTVAEGGAYTYILTYIDPDGTSTLLYSSEDVGGDEISASGDEGLYQATDSLEDYFYLDRLEANEASEITLVVHLEGETQGNTYQDTLAKLQMNFAVELVSETGESTKPVQTGVENNTLLYVGIALGAGLFCLLLAVILMRSQQNNESEGGEQ